MLDHLVDTASALRDPTYSPSRSLCFVARQPKAREIPAADFRDRVLHPVLVPRLEALFDRYAWPGHLFAVADGHLRPRWEPASVTSLRSQLAWFRRTFHPGVALVQLGNRLALFGAGRQAALAQAPWLARWGDVLPEQRPGVAWPLSHIKGIGPTLRGAGRPYAFVVEKGHLPWGMKRRVLRDLFTRGMAGNRRSPQGPARCWGRLIAAFLTNREDKHDD